MSSSPTGCHRRSKSFLSKYVLMPLLVWAAAPAMGADYFYTVKPGDHPWNLAERYF
jgi:hypothetical protein